MILSKELARRYGDKGIVSTSLNPGRQPLLLSSDRLFMAKYNPLFHREHQNRAATPHECNSISSHGKTISSPRTQPSSGQGVPKKAQIGMARYVNVWSLSPTKFLPSYIRSPFLSLHPHDLHLSPYNRIRLSADTHVSSFLYPGLASENHMLTPTTLP